MACSAHIPSSPFDSNSKQSDTYIQLGHVQGFSWSPRLSGTPSSEPVGLTLNTATTLHLWERWEGDTRCLEQKRWGTVSHSKPAHAAKEFENLLTPSIYYPLQSLIHSHWENSSDIKHSYILGRHTQNNSLPCPEIALFLSCNLTSLYFWSQICPQSDCIFRAGKMLVWIIDSYLYEALRIGRAARNFTSWALCAALPLPAKCSSGFIIHVHSLMSHYGTGII